MTTTQRKPATNTFGQISNLYQDQINPNLPLGAPKKNIRKGNPYLDQVKAIDKELKRLEGILEKALKGSDNKRRDLAILNAELRQSGELKRNTLGIDRRFWSRRGIGEQINALKERKTKLTNFLGKENVLLGDTVPQIKGFTPTFLKDIDSHGGVSQINSYYLPFFNEAKKKRDRAAYDTIRSDLTSGSGNIPGMSEIELDKKIQAQLGEGNMFRSDSKFYIGNVNEYGEKKVVRKSDNTQTGEVIAVNNANKYYKGKKDDYAGLLIEQADGTKKAPTSIQRNLLKAGFKPQELTDLMIHDKQWQADRRR